MNTPAQKENLLLPKIIILLYLVIGLVPRFEAVDPIGSHWVYLGVIDLLGLWFLAANTQYVNGLFSSRLSKGFGMAYVLFVVMAGVSLFVALNVSEGVKDLARLVMTIVGFVNVYALFKVAPKALFDWVVKVSHVTIVLVAVQVIAIFAEDFGVARTSKLLKTTELSTFGTQNATAATLVMQLPFILFGIVKHVGKWRIASYIAFLLGFTGILFISARTALLMGMGIVGLFVIFTLVQLRNIETRKEIVSYTILPLLVLSLASYLFVTNVNRVDSSRANTLNELMFSPGAVSKKAPTKKVSSKPKRRTISDNVRPYYYKAALEDFKSSPLTGIGLGNWKLANKDEYFATLNRKGFLYPLRTHNDILQMLAETGIIGGLAYVSLFVFLTIAILLLFFKNQKKEEVWIYLILMFCLMTYGADALINFPMERTPMQGHWMVLSAFIFVFYDAFAKANKASESPSGIKLSKPIVYLLAGLVLVSTAVSYLRYQQYVSHNYFLADTTGKNLLADDYVLPYSKVKRELSGFFTLSGIGRPNAHMMGMYAMNEKKYDEALRHFDKAIKLAPNHYESMMLKAILYNDYKVDKDSAAYYAQIGFEKYPAERNNFILLSNYYLEKKDTTNYFKTMEARLKHNPNDEQAWVMKVTRTDQFFKDDQKTAAVLEEALALHPDNKDLLRLKDKYTGRARKDEIQQWYTDGITFINEGQYQKGKTELLKILELMPKNKAALVNLGINAIKLKEYDEAIAYMTTLIDMKAFNDGRPEYNRGLAYDRLGMKKKASADWRASKAKGFALAQKLSEKQLNQ